MNTKPAATAPKADTAKPANATPAKETGTAVAPVQQNNSTAVGAAIRIGNRLITVTKRVTIPILRHRGGGSVAFTVLGPMYEGKAIGKDRGKPWMIAVRELQSQREHEYIVPAVLRSKFIDEYDASYPASYDVDEKTGAKVETKKAYEGKNTYVGKNFAVFKSEEAIETAAGRRYRPLEVAEFEDNGESVAKEDETPAKK
jgi:hypothetical protein